MQFKYENGQQAKDRITGFKGTITSRCDYMTGCVQYLLSPKIGKDGAAVDSVWFDEDRLDVKVAGAVKLKVAASGGTQRDAPPTS